MTSQEPEPPAPGPASWPAPTGPAWRPPIGVPPSGSFDPRWGDLPPHHNPYAAGPLPRDPDARPVGVLVAAVVTWVVTVPVVLLLAGATVYLLVEPRDLLDELFGDDVGVRDRPAAFAVTLGGLLLPLLWGLAATLAAVLALRRSQGGRVLLVVLAGLTVPVAMVGLVVSWVAVLPLGAAATTCACLLTSPATDWYHHEHLYSPPRPPRL